MTFSPTSNALSAPTNEFPSHSVGFADRRPGSASPPMGLGQWGLLAGQALLSVLASFCRCPVIAR
jgi:hypothetical protein